MNPQNTDLQRRNRALRQLGWWYQDFALPDGVRTGNGQPPCYDPETRWKLFEPQLPASMEGATVLDVGGNAGFFSLQFALRGAAECVIVEPFDEFASQAEFVAKEFRVRFTVLREDVHSYVLTTNRRFDYVIFLGLFYHLRYPTLVLDRLAQMATRQMLFHSLILDDAAGPAADGGDAAEALPPTRMTFLEGIFRNDPTNWWVPNQEGMRALLRAAGHQIVAQPHPELFLTKPVAELGTYQKGSLVLSNFIKPGRPETVYPGPQRVDAKLWQELVEQRWGKEQE